MAAWEGDFVLGEDLDAILTAIDDDDGLFERDFTSELNSVAEEIEEDKETVNFPCNICSKVCKSRRGLSRHQNAKHTDSEPGNQEATARKTTKSTVRDPVAILHPLHF